MKVKTSEHIITVKPLLKQLLDSLLAKYEYASVLASDATGKSYRVSRTGSSILEPDLITERGFVVRVFNNGEAAEYSFSEISEDAIPVILKAIEERLLPLSDVLPAGVSPYSFTVPEDEPLVMDKATDYEEDPVEYGDERIISLLTDIHNKGRAYDSRILDCNVSFVFQRYTKLFLSRNRDLTQSVMWTNSALVTLATRGQEIKDSYIPFSMLGGCELLKDVEASLSGACDTVIALLDSEPMIPGEYDCICTPDTTGMIVHEAFGHGVEMDMFVKNRAQAVEYIDKYVASPLITMRDGAATIPQVASYFFDDEGVIGQDTVIIDKGILRTGICDSIAAAHLKKAPTGNGRRENYEHKAYTRMTNTIFEAGHDRLEDMIASIDYGFMLCEPSSGMEDPKNWGIQCMVSYAREIKDGAFTGKIFSPIVLTGYVPDLLKSISMVSDSIQAGGTGYCGKGYKEWVKVSDGGPYIKARIRLG